MQLPVVLTTKGNLELTRRAYQSLRATTPPELPFEILVALVDNGSHDGTIKWAKGHGLPVWRNPEPMNLSASWNIAMRKCRKFDAPGIVLANNDVYFLPGWHKMLEPIPQAGVVMPHELTAARALEIGWRESPNSETMLPTRTLLARFETCHARGCCFYLPYSTYDSIGPFDETMFTHEDTDYFHRVLRRYKIMRPEDCAIVHEPGQTTKKLPAGRYDQAFFRSRFKLYEKHGFFETWGDAREMVSVVIPVRDRPRQLREALNSVFGQTYNAFRVYVILDRCTDDATAEVVRNFQQRDLRIAGFRTEDYGVEGVSEARNLGVRLAEGKYIAFLDSDDVWLTNHLERHVAYHESHIVHMTYSPPLFAWRYWNPVLGQYHEVPGEPPNVKYTGPFDRARLESENYILTSGTVFFAPTIKDLRFPPGKQMEEDWDVFKACPDPVANIGLETMRYYWEPGGNQLTSVKLPELGHVQG